MQKNFGYLNRNEHLKLASQQTFDVVIIGGGITGAGIALDAVLRGMSVCLIEQHDFASGTSSRSTKLVHGGLRYLKQFKLKLVAEVGRERTIVRDMAPHLTYPVNVVVPITQYGSLSGWQIRLAMLAYEWLANVPKSLRHEYIQKSEVLKRLPELEQKELLGAIDYVEFKTNDARLTTEVIKSAVSEGAIALNHLKAINFGYDANGKIDEVHALDLLNKTELVINTKNVINAAGPWVDAVVHHDSPELSSKLIHTKGIHIVVPHSKIPIKRAVYFDTSDGRMVFAIPKKATTYIGTTDTLYHGQLEEPTASMDDVQYLIKASNSMFPNHIIHLEDVESMWIGLRPLIREEGKKPSDISRKDEIFETSSGLISIAGGKLTGFRTMAEKIVDMVSLRVFNTKKNCVTSTYKLGKHPFNTPGEFDEFKKSILATNPQHEPELLKELCYLFGKDVEQILLIDPKNLVLSSLEYCLNHESVYTISDFFIRRTGWIYFRISWVKEYKKMAAEYLKSKRDLSDEEINHQLSELDTLIDIATKPH